MSKNLKTIINDYYISQQRDRKKVRFYISEAGKCPRQVFYSFKDTPKKALDPNFLRLFDQGDHMHQMIMKSLLSAKGVKVIAAEINIPPQNLISGRADAIIEKDRELFVLDIKSINSRAFGYLKEAKEDNVKQLQLYLHYFQIQKGILLYVDKDKLRLKEYEVIYDRVEAERLISELTTLQKQIDSNVLPPRLKDYPKFWGCKYCRYKKTCDK